MGKAERRSRFPWNILISVPPSILAILCVVLLIITWFEPVLEATANGGNWKVPSDVEEELKGIVQVNNMCKDLKENLNDLEKELVHPDICAAFVDVCDVACEIIGDISELSVYEANNVESLRTMYTIEIENNGDITSNRIVLEITDAKYVQYENHGKRSTETGDFRDDKCRIVPMGRLEPDGRIVANAWVICSVSPDGCFKITQDYHGDVPLYMKTPVRRVAEWVNKPPHMSLALVLMLFFVSVSCFITYRLAK